MNQWERGGRGEVEGMKNLVPNLAEKKIDFPKNFSVWFRGEKIYDPVKLKKCCAKHSILCNLTIFFNNSGILIGLQAERFPVLSAEKNNPSFNHKLTVENPNQSRASNDTELAISPTDQAAFRPGGPAGTHPKGPGGGSRRNQKIGVQKIKLND